MDNELKAKKLMKRIEKISQAFWNERTQVRISHKEWCVYYFNMMRAGERLKATGVKYNPRSKRYPLEFMELFRCEVK